ncbi:flagellar basal-body rod protein FlgB [Anopheles sinensis]|uniref:Flagellar basal-body rod protein FlgB n=1 Tax=Anopheles sinensis TaxID=74873 RepID=A0A084WGD0_ANOSI|nr:flagellar basal-body rod protein FlgB [Anopheles sinensis]
MNPRTRQFCAVELVTDERQQVLRRNLANPLTPTDRPGQLRTSWFCGAGGKGKWP